MISSLISANLWLLFLATVEAHTRAVPATQHISPRALYQGGWPLASIGSTTTCPSTTPVQCTSTIVNLSCCPSGQTCIFGAGQDANYCCPTSVDCNEAVLNFPRCANTTWTMFQQKPAGYFCCEPGLIGINPTGVSITGGLCEPVNQVIPTSLLATIVAQVTPSATATATNQTEAGGPDITNPTASASSTSLANSASNILANWSTGMKVGVGIAAVVAVLVVLAFCSWCRRRTARRYVYPGTEYDRYDENGNLIPSQALPPMPDCAIRRILKLMGDDVEIDAEYPYDGYELLTPHKHKNCLFLAISGRHFDVVQLLLEHGADPLRRNCLSVTPLYLALMSGHDGIIEVIANHVDDLPNYLVHSDEKFTPLHTACCYGLANWARHFLEKGIDIEAKDSCDRTAFRLAIATDFLGRIPDAVESLKPSYIQIFETVRVLVEFGADPTMDSVGRNRFCPIDISPPRLCPMAANVGVRHMDPKVRALFKPAFEVVDKAGPTLYAQVVEESVSRTPLCESVPSKASQSGCHTIPPTSSKSSATGSVRFTPYELRYLRGDFLNQDLITPETND
ncbi:hypothetical protein G7Y89_g9537 [Cudoniella acicularis]|uniref:Uncharacterized protein n=1 Tax=Cudoniella acicularis TaxID=354080 RepID=A0A8H4VZJ3_9HELO|nr:hypothetical protein G7Y89_g9537 [Cudoniella acicularis]